MKLSDFNYDLPKEYIAQSPLDKRDESKLMVIDRTNGNIEHKKFYDVINYMDEGDVLVINNTKVIPARLIGNIVNKNSNVEVFLVRRIDEKKWECLVKPGKKLKVGVEVVFGNGELSCKIVDIIEDGNRVVEFEYEGIFEEILDKLGEMPLPPYIKEKLIDKNKYQTVYAKYDGSVAAPTAGLHFTKELLEKIKEKKIKIANVTLHVSLGTFRPVKVDVIEEHEMHKEHIILKKEDSDLINNAIKNKKNIICVGTTSLRSVESLAYFDDSINLYQVKNKEMDTDIFIYPGYKFKIVNKLITNFHLPCSTLIMLVSAFAGRENVLNAYEIAKKNNYRFFSFGDACIFV